jgi:hypothetical protein
LVTAVLDVHAGVAVWDIPAVDVSDAAHRRLLGSEVFEAHRE